MTQDGYDSIAAKVAEGVFKEDEMSFMRAKLSAFVEAKITSAASRALISVIEANRRAAINAYYQALYGDMK
jgi:hypothetical protein